jgi:hypothetical protein
MEERYAGPNVYRPMMAGLFVGIIATVFNIFYDVMYRQSTGFELSTIINVSTLIFGTLLLTLAAGSIYALLAQFIKKPTLVYSILFGLLAILCLRFALHVYRTDDPLQNKEFHQLFAAIVIITSLATLCVPLLVKKGSTII